MFDKAVRLLQTHNYRYLMSQPATPIAASVTTAELIEFRGQPFKEMR